MSLNEPRHIAHRERNKEEEKEPLLEVGRKRRSSDASLVDLGASKRPRHDLDMSNKAASSQSPIEPEMIRSSIQPK